MCFCSFFGQYPRDERISAHPYFRSRWLFTTSVFPDHSSAFQLSSSSICPPFALALLSLLTEVHALSARPLCVSRLPFTWESLTALRSALHQFLIFMKNRAQLLLILHGYRATCVHMLLCVCVCKTNLGMFVCVWVVSGVCTMATGGQLLQQLINTHLSELSAPVKEVSISKTLQMRLKWTLTLLKIINLNANRSLDSIQFDVSLVHSLTSSHAESHLITDVRPPH